MRDKKLMNLRVMPGFPMSRDFAMENIDCDVTSCICNKNRKCEVPSRISINKQGKCKGLLTDQKEKK